MEFIGKMGVSVFIALHTFANFFGIHLPAAVIISVASTTPQTSNDASTTPVEMFTTDLHYGLVHSQDVTNLQDFLASEGLFDGVSNGNYLSFKRQAVKAFQIQQGIDPVTGFFNGDTRSSANEIIAQEETSTPASSTSDTSNTLTHADIASANADFASTTNALTQDIADLVAKYKTLEDQVSTLTSAVDTLQAQTSSADQSASNSSSDSSVNSTSGSMDTTPPANSTSSSTMTTASYIGNGYGIGDMSFIFPPDWQAQGGSGGVQAVLGPTGDPSVQLLVYMSKTSLSQADFITSYKTLVTQQYPGWQDPSSQGGSGMSLITIPITNPPTAQQYIMPQIIGIPSTNSSGQQIGKMVLIFVYKGNAYRLEASAPAIKWQTFQSVIMGIFNNIKLKG
jgi:hypothetical protein